MTSTTTQRRRRVTKLFTEFFESEKAGGLLLIACTVVSLLIANSGAAASYEHLWHMQIGPYPLEFWINDGLMAIFFFLIGLEVEREIYIGELSNLRNAVLPFVAAVGGIAVPAGVHYFMNHGTPYQEGLGIPMATDIAFSLGILSLLGSRVPASLKIFLTALAIIDDIGAILVIAIFYSKGFSVGYFGAAVAIFALMLGLNRLKVYRVWPYLLLGIGLWYCLHYSGIHATIAGVLTAFALPFGDGGEKSPSYHIQHILHKPVAFVILPLFALANTGITIPADWTMNLASSNSLGIMAGLVIGKPVGIFIFTMAAVLLGITALPSDFRRTHLLGVGLLAGIGFTMSIFITLLAFSDKTTVIHSKIAILIASVVAGVLGFLMLRLTLPSTTASEEEFEEVEE